MANIGKFKKTEFEPKEGMVLYTFNIQCMMGTYLLEYHKFEIVKMHRVTCKIKTIENCGIGAYGPSMNISRMKHPNQAIVIEKDVPKLKAYIKKACNELVKQHTEQLEWYTPKHPEWEMKNHFPVLLKDFADLLDNYSIKAHEKVQRKHQKMTSKIRKKWLE